MIERKKLGRSDKLDFPDLGLEDAIVKMDTGAYSSSIHTIYTKEVIENGQKHLEFTIYSEGEDGKEAPIHTTADYTSKIFKSSFGEEEERYVIRTNVIVFGEEYPIILSLSNRVKMKHPILIGRRFISRKFIVDPAFNNLSYKHKKKSKI